MRKNTHMAEHTLTWHMRACVLAHTHTDQGSPPKKKHYVCIHTLEPPIHPSHFHSVLKIHPLKFKVWSENTL